MSSDQKPQPTVISPQTEKEVRQLLNAVKELNGPKGPEPTRYGDWEVKGRVSDF